jgi:hypothetical protein
MMIAVNIINSLGLPLGAALYTDVFALILFVLCTLMNGKTPVCIAQWEATEPNKATSSIMRRPYNELLGSCTSGALYRPVDELKRQWQLILPPPPQQCNNIQGVCEQISCIEGI